MLEGGVGVVFMRGRRGEVRLRDTIYPRHVFLGISFRGFGIEWLLSLLLALKMDPFLLEWRRTQVLS